jgi:hypothetical protein
VQGGGMERKRVFLNETRAKAKQCWVCEAKNNLNVHHVDFNHANDDITNVIVVCKRCHGKLHFLFQLMNLQSKNWVVEK